MTTFDAGQVWYSYQNLEGQAMMGGEEETGLSTSSQLVKHLKDFIVTYGVSLDTTATSGLGYYAQQLTQQQVGRPKLTVDLEHVRTINPELALALEEKPTQNLPLFEQAAGEVLRESYANDDDGVRPEVGEVQVLLWSSAPLGSSSTCSIRDLPSDRVSKLVMITGITTAASRPRHKATRLTVQCQDCKATTSVACRPGLGGANIPRVCSNRQAVPGMADEQCKLDSMQVLPDRSEYVDQQTLKLQEKPEDVPTGEMPRTVQVVADRHLVNRVTPGTRITVLGIYSTFRSSAMEKGPAALQQPYIHAVSIVEDAGDSHSTFNFTQEEIVKFDNFARAPNVHAEIFGYIAPNIFGSEDIKKAVAVLLFGGARKTMPDGTSRRGDVNVLLLGDPSTAKSQFLKYASKVAPISVYTSGKGSSAAGLTASVIQDPNTREFYLEGGAMVLADNGVVCIDEFDKMRPEDRVAIHEAMEQQTISIAKAGITTMLKSRTSVLAAANPPSGRYDDLKSAQDNIDLQSTILSRFDLIFIVKDPQTVERDKAIAEKVLDNHRLGGQAGGTARSREAADESAEDCKFLKRYIHYARSQCQPRLSEQAQERLAAYYVDIRDAARQACVRDETDTPPVPITVRQLEALIRISESLARMGLQTVATLEHVEMAIDLFKKSTMDAVKSGITTYSIDSDPQRQAIHRLEDKVRRRLHIGSYITLRRLMDEMVALGETESLIMRALVVMNQQGECEFRRERSVVHRIR